MNEFLFPFSAVIGQDDAKEALICGAINPRIGGVLLSGQKGCAKSTLVRAFGRILKDSSIISMPLNVTEDMLLGTIDIENTIADGNKRFLPGLLKRANGNALYVDEINLLTKSIANGLLDVCQSGCAVIEREGVSEQYASSFLLIGTMNPEEGLMDPQLADRFGLYVQMKGTSDKKARVEIIKRKMEFDQNPIDFCMRFKEQDCKLEEKIANAKNALPNVSISEEMIEYASEISHTAGTQGHRAEIFISETALAIAAYDEREEVIKEDIHKAARFVLPHRIREAVSKDRMSYEQSNTDAAEEEQTKDLSEEKNQNKSSLNENEMPDTAPPPERDNEQKSCEQEEKLEMGREIYSLNDIFPNKKSRDTIKGSGRRSKTASGTEKGRYIGFGFPKRKCNDIAFDATLRAAAVHQKTREKNGMKINIHKDDLRQKKREHRVGNTIFFAVDASGSMGAKKRMIETKNAVLSLLYNAYQKRDSVGLIAFRKNDAEVLLPVTRSIDLAKKRLQLLPTGGRTPLVKGMTLSLNMICAEKIKDKDMLPLFILITDGKANDRDSAMPYQDAIEIADEFSRKKIPSIVIDTEKSVMPLGIAKEIAQHMGADYFKTEEIKSELISNLIYNNYKIQ